jgi:FeS assembly SUF system regulator
MFSISKLTDYAVLLMTHVAAESDTVFSASMLAEQTGLTVPTVSKLLKSLARAELLRSKRGSTGGYSLALTQQAISLVDIIKAVEGHIGLTACSATEGGCSLQAICRMRSNWQLINNAIFTALSGITLADLLTNTLSSGAIQTVIHQHLQRTTEVGEKQI